MRTRSIAVLAAWLLLTTLPPGATAQSEESTADAAERVVAIREPPPFSIRSGDDWSGLSVQAWEEVARGNGWRFRYVPVELDEAIEGTRNGRFDVAVGAFTITAERERELDFSHPSTRPDSGSRCGPTAVGACGPGGFGSSRSTS